MSECGDMLPDALPGWLIVVVPQIQHPECGITGTLVRTAISGYYMLMIRSGAIKVPQEWARDQDDGDPLR